MLGRIIEFFDNLINKTGIGEYKSRLLRSKNRAQALRDRLFEITDESIRSASKDGAKAYVEGKTGVRHSIGYTTNNKPVVIVDNDILNGISKSRWDKTVKGIISNKFSNGIPIRGRIIKVNKISRNEYSNSKYTKFIRDSNGKIYVDKFKSANNLDEIIIASTNYINEDLKHSRNDNFKEFARGDVLICIGKRKIFCKSSYRIYFR